jgi:cystathionine beta-lyase
MQSDCNAGICEIRVPTLRRLRTLHPAARSVVPVNGVSAAPSATNPLVELSLSQLRERTSMKWRAHPADVLPLWVAEMDVLLAPPIAAALTDAIARGDTGYPVGTAYAEAVRDFAAERWGWHGLVVERTAVVPDVMMGIVEILRLLTEPGDPVVVCAPVYPPFYAFVSHADRRVLEAPLGPDGRTDMDALGEAFARARASSARPVFLMSNPHNPTGAVHTRAELEAIAALAARYGVRVISDEIHAPLILGTARFTPYLSVDGAGDAFALLSASKAWNLAGIKAALAVAGPDAASDLARLPEEVGHGPSHLGVIAHSAAFRDGGAWLDRLLTGLTDNRALLEQLLAEHLPAIGYIRPEGTYLAWLDCTRLHLDAEPVPDGPGIVSDVAGPARYFLDHARVALSSGHVFGSGGAGHVRLNFATHPDILTAAITRMARALDTPAASATPESRPRNPAH